MRVVVTDNELSARAKVRRFLADAGDFEVIGEASDGRAAARVIAADDPDLVFVDVRMPLVAELDATGSPKDRRALVVFTTVYDQLAVQAFELNAVDYLLKPFSKQQFGECLQRVLAHRHNTVAKVAAVIRDLSAGHVNRLLVKSGADYRFVETRDIEWLEAAGNYVRIHLRTGKRHLIRGPLGAVAAVLDQSIFRRVHRSIVVNVESIATVRSIGHGDLLLTLRTGRLLRVSRTHRGELLG